MNSCTPRRDDFLLLDCYDAGHLPPPALDEVFDLFAPVSRARFEAEYWEQRPLLVRGRARAMSEVVGMPAVDRILGGHVLRPSDLRAVRSHMPLAVEHLFPEGVADKQAALAAFACGHTLVFDQVERHLPALAKLLHAWESELELTVRSNAFLTPRSSSGFHRHFDTHDVVVVQLHGVKTWDICDAPLPLPHEEQQPQSSQHAGRARLVQRVDLSPGDVLYLPRGFVHAAEASQTDTLHLSVSIRNRARREVMLQALRACMLADPALRASYVPGRMDPAAAGRRACDAAAQADLRRALEGVSEAFHAARRSPVPRLRAIEEGRRRAAAARPHECFDALAQGADGHPKSTPGVASAEFTVTPPGRGPELAHPPPQIEGPDLRPTDTAHPAPERTADHA